MTGINSVTLKYAEFKATGVLHKAVHSFMRKYFGGWVLDKYKYGDIMKHFITPEDYMDRYTHSYSKKRSFNRVPVEKP